ncbi:MAG: TetR/AcrR family transcriptional regulator [Acidimicrobiales bacterium]
MTQEPNRPGRPPGRSREPAERRRAILDAAVTAIRREGPDVSMEQIAREAGVTKPTVYDNFDGKAGLTEALLERYGLELLREIGKKLSGPASAEDVIRGGVEALLTFVEREPAVFRFIVTGTGTHSLIDEAGGVLSSLIGGTLRRAGVDSGAAELYAYSVLGAIFAATDWWAARRTMSRSDFLDYLVGMLWSGLERTGLGRVDGPIDLTVVAEAIADAESPQVGTECP